MSEPRRADPHEVTIRRADPDGPEARACLSRYFAELADVFEGGFDPAASPDADPIELTPPRGAFLLAEADGSAVGCGSVRVLSSGVAYVKRMWVDGGLRGVGLGRRMLDALEAEARGLGCDTVRLETNRALTAAIALYRSSGYEEIEPFIDEPYADYWFEKRLG